MKESLPNTTLSIDEFPVVLYSKINHTLVLYLSSHFYKGRGKNYVLVVK